MTHEQRIRALPAMLDFLPRHGPELNLVHSDDSRGMRRSTQTSNISTQGLVASWFFAHLEFLLRLMFDEPDTIVTGESFIATTHPAMHLTVRLLGCESAYNRRPLNPECQSIRMSRGPSARKLKPRSARSSCGEDTPEEKHASPHQCTPKLNPD